MHADKTLQLVLSLHKMGLELARSGPSEPIAKKRHILTLDMRPVTCQKACLDILDLKELAPGNTVRQAA